MKIMLVGQSGSPTGYGRIADGIALRLIQRGHHVHAVSFTYDGMLPAALEGVPLPYHVSPLSKNAPDFHKILGRIHAVAQPEVVLVIEDMPWCLQVQAAAIDWSLSKLAIFTPADGAPVSPAWVKGMRMADARMTMSEFGEQAWREAGIACGYVPVGVDANTFFRKSDEDRLKLRAAIGLAADAFVVGVMATNGGRKMIPDMMRAFDEFAKGRDDVFLLLDMDKDSPFGWNLPEVIEQQGWDGKKIVWREEVVRRLPALNDRYNLLDGHMLISSREGFGLPILESMATGAVNIALRYCTGEELLGDERGLLVDPIEYRHISTWGGAEACFPSQEGLVEALESLYRYEDGRAAMSQASMEFARARSWDMTTDCVEIHLLRAL